MAGDPTLNCLRPHSSTPTVKAGKAMDIGYITLLIISKDIFSLPYYILVPTSYC